MQKKVPRSKQALVARGAYDDVSSEPLQTRKAEGMKTFAQRFLILPLHG